MGEVLDPFELPHGRIFWYLEKNGVLKFFERVFRPGKFSGSCLNLSQFCQNCYDTKEIEQAIHSKVHDQKDLFDQFGHLLENEHTNR